MTDDLAAGRKAYAEHRWADAYAHLSSADRSAALDPSDLELLAESARWSRHFEILLDLLERTGSAYGEAGDDRGAARLALSLAASTSSEATPPSPAAGWLGPRRCSATTPSAPSTASWSG